MSFSPFHFVNAHIVRVATMTVAKTLEPFVCGGSAATFASVVIHPMDLAKVSQ